MSNETTENVSELSGIILKDFFMETPLYKKMTEPESEKLCSIFAGEYSNICNGGGAKFRFKGYNPITHEDTNCQILNIDSHAITVKVVDGRDIRVFNVNNSIFFTVTLLCKTSDQKFDFRCYWDAMDKSLQKIGQYPSLADFHTDEIKQYKAILPDEKMQEFVRATGLYAHGVGIGAFVYLRRIFEHLIQEASKKALEKKTIKQEDFDKARMDEKVKMLADYLPEFLVKNTQIYSILSKGVHELDEDTCKKYFIQLQNGIEIILDENLENFRKKKKIEKAKIALQAVSQDIKGS